jgi:hypothetical protein
VLWRLNLPFEVGDDRLGVLQLLVQLPDHLRLLLQHRLVFLDPFVPVGRVARVLGRFLQGLFQLNAQGAQLPVFGAEVFQFELFVGPGFRSRLAARAGVTDPVFRQVTHGPSRCAAVIG